MIVEEGRWLLSVNGVDWREDKTYSSRGEAIALAVNDLDLVPGEDFSIGRAARPTPAPVDAEVVLDMAKDDLYEQAGENAVGAWPSPTRLQINELESLLTSVFHAWLKKHSMFPVCYMVEDVEECVVPGVLA